MNKMNMNRTGTDLLRPNIIRRGVSRNALAFAFIPAILFALKFTFFGCSEDDGGRDGSMISCRTDNACIEVSADACLELGGQKVQSCEAISSSSDGKEPSSSSSGNNISSSSEEDPIAGSSSSSDESLVSSSSSEDSQSSSSSEGSGVVCDAGTVKIGEQCWMKKNLYTEPTGANGAATNSWCNGNEPYDGYDVNDTNCDKYGRLYDWATAMALPASCNSISCASQVQSPHRGICPEGFHIPSNTDWDKLYRTVDGNTGTSSPYNSATAGTKLKSSTLWNSYNGIPEGEGDNGFAALPGGNRYSDGSFYDVGDNGYWWSASEYYSSYAYRRRMGYSSEGAYWGNNDRTIGYSVRCVMD